MSYALPVARTIAEKIIADIAPFCERCDIAGSVRREKPEVKDIEIVCIPRFEDVPGAVDLFGEKKMVRNVLRDHLAEKTTVRWIKPGTSVIEDWPLKPDAKYWRGLMPNGIKIDIFLARPENYGLIYLMRTGSMEFNVAMFTHGKRIRRPVRDGWLWVDRVRRDTPEEIDVFNWLGLRWVEPRDRLGEMAVRKSEFAEKGGLHLVAEKPKADWNAIAAASPFVATRPAEQTSAVANSRSPGHPLTPSVPFDADYCYFSNGECYPITVLELSETQARIRFADGVQRPPNHTKEGWFPRCYLC